MKFNALTIALHNFITIFSAGAGRMTGYANTLLYSLAAIDVVLLGLWWALDGGERLSAIFKRILYFGLWIWMVREFPSLSKTFVDSLVKAGQIAGGGAADSKLLLDPSKIAGYGLDATEPLAKKIEDLHITEFADGIVYGFSYLAIMGCFLLMAIHVFLAVLEYYLITSVVAILMPFGLLKSTKFLAKKAMGAIVACGIKLMVLSLILSAIEPVLRTSLKFSSPDVPMNELFAMFLTVCALMLLTWKAPNVASSLISGHPTLGGSDAMAPMTAAAGVAIGAATAGASYLATKAAAGGDKSKSASGAKAPGASSAAASVRGASPKASSPRKPSGPDSPASEAATTASNSEAPRADKTLVMSSQQAPSPAPAPPRSSGTGMSQPGRAGTALMPTLIRPAPNLRASTNVN